MRCPMLTVCGLLAGSLLVAGCGRGEQQFQPYEKAERVEDDHGHHHEHGPHGGHVIDLGDHEYLAEVVFNEETKTITVYLTDHDTGEPLPIAEEQITLMLAIDGEQRPFALQAAPQDGDPEGRSSRFELAGDETIAEHIQDEEDLEGELRVTIEGREVTGHLDHDHHH